MKPCVMCKVEFDAAELDYLGRCEPCFHKYMEMKDWDKPNLGVPNTKGYNSTWGKR